LSSTAALRLHQAGNGQQRRALAGAIGTDQGRDLAFVQGQADALDRFDVAIGHRQVLDLQNGLLVAAGAHASSLPR
jgi:hypothetical protein